MSTIPRPCRDAERVSAASILLIVTAMTLGGCRSSNTPTPATNASAPPPPAATSAQTAVVTQTSWAADALEELFAPIALYPDQLVGQILAASVNPQEVLDAGNWLLQNQNLKGDALDAAAEKVGFGPA